MVSSAPTSTTPFAPVHRGVLRIATIALCTLWVSTAWAQSVRTQISSHEVNTQGHITYSVQTEGSVQNIVPPQSKDFRVVGRSTRTSISFVNGKTTRRLTTSYQLVPLRAGALRTGRAQVMLRNGKTLQGKSFRVTASDTVAPSTGNTPGGGQMPSFGARPGFGAPPGFGGGFGAGTGPGFHMQFGTGNMPGSTQNAPSKRGATTQNPAPSQTQSTAPQLQHYPPLPPPSSDALFTKNDFEPPQGRPFLLGFTNTRTAVVGEPILVEYVYFEPLTSLGFQATDMDEPSFDNAWFKNITAERQQQRQAMSQVQMQGRIYNAQIIRSYMVVPLKSGRYTIPALGLTIEGHTFTRRLTPITITSPTLTISVDPLPQSGRPPHSVDNVGRYHIEASVQPQQARVGDTIRLNVQISGIGIPAELHAPHITLPAHLRAQPPRDTHETSVHASGWIETTRTRTIAFQATQEGSYTIDPIAFHWYDPWKGGWQTVNTDALTFEIEGVNPTVNITDPKSGKPKEVAASWVQELPTGASIPDNVSFIARMREGHTPWRGNPLYYILLGLPVLGFLGVMSMGAFRRRRNDTQQTRQAHRAGPTALRALKQCAPGTRESYAEMDRIVRQYLRLHGIPGAKGATLSELQETLLEARSPEHTQTLITLLEALPEARYGDADESRFKHLRTALIDWIKHDQERRA